MNKIWIMMQSKSFLTLNTCLSTIPCPSVSRVQSCTMLTRVCRLINGECTKLIWAKAFKCCKFYMVVFNELFCNFRHRCCCKAIELVTLGTRANISILTDARQDSFRQWGIDDINSKQVWPTQKYSVSTQLKMSATSSKENLWCNDKEKPSLNKVACSTLSLVSICALYLKIPAEFKTLWRPQKTWS